jgi:Flp pilus assembly protein TadG
VAAAEFALVGGLLMLIVLGTVEVGRYLLFSEAVRTVAADAVRMATVRGSANLNAGVPACQGVSGTLAGAGSRVPLLRAQDLAVTLRDCATSGAVTTVMVEVRYDLGRSSRFLPGVPAQITETSRAVFY